MKSSSQQIWSVLVFAFGAFAVFFGTFGAIGSLIGFSAAHGCDGMAIALFGFGAVTLLLLGVPHVLIGWMGIAGKPRAASKLRVLAVLNIIVNLCTIVFIAMQIGFLGASPWILLAIANVALLFTLRADPAAAAS